MYSADVSAGDDIIASQYNNLRKDVYQAGSIVEYGGSIYTPPSGWLICDGSAISRSIYANLFAAIGTTFGSGDGSTTFNLPNCTTKFIIGAKAGTYNLGSTGGISTFTLAANELPSHTHPIVNTGTAHTHNILTYRTSSGTGRMNERTDLQTAGISAITKLNAAHTHGGSTGNYGQASPTAIDIIPAHQYTNFIICYGLTNNVSSGDHLWNYHLNNARQELGTAGIITHFTNASMPAGWLLCDGSAISRSTYADLFAIIGTYFGVGNGSTTFNLPNLTERFIRGAVNEAAIGTTGGLNTVTLTANNVPQHLHSIASQAGHTHNSISPTYNATGGSTTGIQQPSITQNVGAPVYTEVAGGHDHTGNTDATGSATAFIALPKYLALAYMIKV